MDTSPSYSEIARKAKISPSYANEIVNGGRKPSLAMALRIYDATGLTFGPLSGLDQPQIDVARKMAQAA